jgi:transcription-repair coupling factor (superfamily II helicase)
VRDRYGPLPASVLNLADYARIRLLADRIGLESLDREGPTVVCRFRQDAPLDAAFLVRFVQTRRDVRLTPPATLTLDLKAAPASPGGARRREGDGGASWWTARALAGEVVPGFSREAILRPPPEDPRAPDGLFARVGGLLSGLAEGLRVG